MEKEFSEIIDRVNGELDAKQLLVLAGCRAEDIIPIGEQLKCFCPVHKGTEYKSLQVNPKERTAQCAVNECAAHQDLSLVELYSLCREIHPPAAAAVSLAHQFDIPLSPKLLEDFGKHFEDKARKQLQGDELLEALDSAELALQALPESPSLWEVKAEAEEALGQSGDAAKSALKAVDLYEKSSLPLKALAVLELKALRGQFDNVDILRRKVALEEAAQSPASQRGETLALFADRLAAVGQVEEAVDALESYIQINPEDAQSRLSLAELMNRAGRGESAEAQFEEAARLLEQSGETSQALGVIERLIRERPQDVLLRERSARLREELGDTAGTVRDLESLARHAQLQEDTEAEIEFLARISRLDPRNLYANERLAEIYDRKGNVHLQVEHLFAAADVLVEMELFERAMPAYEKITTLAPKTIEQTRRLAESLAELGSFESAADQFLAYGEVLQATGQDDEAAEAFRRVADLTPEDGDRLQRAASFLSASGRNDDALDLLIVYIHSLLDIGESESGLQLCRQLRQSFPDVPRLEGTYVDCLLAVKQENELAEYLATCSPDALDKEWIDRALESCPDNPAILETALLAMQEKADEERELQIALRLARAPQASIAQKTGAAERAAELAPDKPESYSALGLAFLAQDLKRDAARAFMQACEKYLEAENLEAARYELELAEDAESEDLRVAELRARVELATGDAEGALASLIAFYTQAHAEQAIDSILQMVPLHGEQLDLPADLALSVADLLRDRSQERDASPFLLCAARDAGERGDWEESAEVLDQIIELNPQSYKALKLRADANLFLGEDDKAVSDLTRAAQMAIECDAEDVAVECLEDLRARNEISAEDSVTLTCLYAKRGDLEIAIDVLTNAFAAVSSMPTETVALEEMLRERSVSEKLVSVVLAEAFARSGRIESAERQYVACEKFLREAGDTGDLLESLKRTRKDYPGNAQLMRIYILALAEVEEKEGFEAKAREELSRFLPEVKSREDAGKMFDALEEALPRSPAIACYHAEFELLGGENRKAAALFRQSVEFAEQFGDQSARLLGLNKLLDTGAAESSDLLDLIEARKQAEDEDGVQEALQALCRAYIAEGKVDALADLAARELARISPNLKQAEQLLELLILRDVPPAWRAGARAFCEVAEDFDDYDSILALSQFLKERVPDDPDNMRREAGALVEIGEQEQAAEAWRRIVDAHAEAGRYPLAEEAALSILDSLPDDSTLIEYCIDVLAKKSARRECANVARAYALQRLEHGETEEVEHLVSRLMAEEPGAFEYIRLKAELLKVEGRIESAATALREYSRTIVEKDAVSARRALELLIEYSPDSIEDLESLASLILISEGPERAEPVFLRCIDQYAAQTDDSTEFLEKTESLLKPASTLFKPRKAVCEYLREMGDEERAVPMLAAVADELYENGNLAEAIAAMDLLHRWRSRDPAYAAKLAGWQDEAGNPGESLALWQEAASIFGENSDWDSKRTALEQIIRLNPGDLSAVEDLASICEDVGDLVSASQHFTALAHIHIGKEKFDEANEALRRAQSLDPDNMTIAEELAGLYLKTDQKTKAISTWISIAEKLEAQEKIDEAVDSLRRALKRLPTATELHLLLIQMLRLQRDFGSLIDEVRSLGEYFLQEGKVQDAKSLLEAQCSALIEEKRYHYAEDLLADFSSLVEEYPEIARFQALVLEGKGEDEAASVAWLELAERQMARERYEEEQAALRRAIALKPGDVELRRRLITALKRYEAEQITELVTEYRELAELLEESSPEEAISLYEQVLEIDEEHIETLASIAGVFKKLGRDKEAVEQLRKMGHAAHSFGQLDKAEAAYQKVLAAEPEDIESLRGLYQILDQTRKHTELQDIARRLAMVLESKGQYDLAIAVWLNLVNQMADDPEIRQRLADLYIANDDRAAAMKQLQEKKRILLDAEDIESAAAVLEQVAVLDPLSPAPLEEVAAIYRKRGDKQLEANYLCRAAMLRSETGDHHVAVQTSDQLTADFPDSLPFARAHAAILQNAKKKDRAAAEYLRLANLLEEAGSYEEARDSYAETLEIFPNHEQARRGVARTLEMLADHAGAAREWLELARYHLKGENYAAAMECCEKAMELSPDSLDNHEVLAAVYAAAKNKEKAAEVLRWLSDKYAEHHEFQKAMDRAEAALSHLPSIDLYLHLARLSEKMGKRDKAVGYLDEAERLARDSDDKERLREALLLASEICPLDPTRIRRAALVHLGNREIERAQRLYLDALKSLLDEGEVESARTLVKDAKDNLPDNLEFRIAAAAMFRDGGIPELAIEQLLSAARDVAQEGDFARALEYVDEASSLKPNDVATAELRFSILLDSGRLRPCYELAEQLTTIYTMRGEIDKAIEMYRRLAAHAPKDLYPHEKLARLLEVQGGIPEASGEWRKLADLYTESHQSSKALLALRRSGELEPDDIETKKRYVEMFLKEGSEKDLVNDFMDLGERLAESGSREEAVEWLERAHRAEPDGVKPLEKLVAALEAAGLLARAEPYVPKLAELYAKDGKARKARELIDRFLAQSTATPMFRVEAGRILRSINARGAAAREFRLAAKAFLESRDFEHQAEVLRDLIEADPLDLDNHSQLIDALLACGKEEEAVEAIEGLANTYRDRGLYDLAVTEYRRITDLRPDRDEIWQAMFDCSLQISDEKEVIPDYTAYADNLAARGRANEAIEYYLRVIELDPRNVEARRGYITQYPKIGRLSDIVDDIISFAQFLVESGEVDEGIGYFELVMSVDPGNTVARDMLSATQSRERDSAQAQNVKEVDTSIFDELDISSTQEKLIQSDSISASDFLLGAIDEMEKKENASAMRQIEQNYRDILSMNPQNAGVRMKLADVLKQMGRTPEMLEQLEEASEALFNKGELKLCIAACEKILQIKPQDQKIRKRLNEAILKQDAFKALESAILFSDHVEDPDEDEGPNRTTDP